MSWLCAEVRDHSALEMLMQLVRTQTADARQRGSFDPEARVYVAPFKNAHRLFFNPQALATLPILRGLAHAPCDEPQEHEMREPMCA
jgi:hypothetical protein